MSLSPNICFKCGNISHLLSTCPEVQQCEIATMNLDRHATYFLHVNFSTTPLSRVVTAIAGLETCDRNDVVLHPVENTRRTRNYDSHINHTLEYLGFTPNTYIAYTIRTKQPRQPHEPCQTCASHLLRYHEACARLTKCRQQMMECQEFLYPSSGTAIQTENPADEGEDKSSTDIAQEDSLVEVTNPVVQEEPTAAVDELSFITTTVDVSVQPLRRPEDRLYQAVHVRIEGTPLFRTVNLREIDSRLSVVELMRMIYRVSAVIKIRVFNPPTNHLRPNAYYHAFVEVANESMVKTVLALNGLVFFKRKMIASHAKSPIKDVRDEDAVCCGNMIQVPCTSLEVQLRAQAKAEPSAAQMAALTELISEFKSKDVKKSASTLVDILLICFQIIVRNPDAKSGDASILTIAQTHFANLKKCDHVPAQEVLAHILMTGMHSLCCDRAGVSHVAINAFHSLKQCKKHAAWQRMEITLALFLQGSGVKFQGCNNETRSLKSMLSILGVRPQSCDRWEAILEDAVLYLWQALSE